MDIVEMGWGGVAWIRLAQDRYKWRGVVKAVMNLGVPRYAGNLSSSYTTCGLASSSQLHRGS
jgi:hypothetical protein